MGKSLSSAADSDLHAAENALRDLIRHVLGQTEDPKQLGVTQERVDKWMVARTEDAKRRDGVVPETRLLYFADFTDLLTIIKKNWDVFKPCFDDQRKLCVYLDRLAELRNPQAPSRELMPFEVDLVAGMTGEIRNQITLFLSATDDGETEYFARIERVTDSLGHSIAGAAVDGTGVSVTGVTLRPGDSMTFHCEAWDPDGSDLFWQVFMPGRIEDVGVGQALEFTWLVEPRDIGERQFLRFQIRSQRDYHRNGGPMDHDDAATLGYRVLPSRSATRSSQT